MAIAFDAVSPNAYLGTTVTTITSGSWTVGAGASRYMVALASDTGTVHADATAVKWGGSSGTALTKLAAGVAIGSFGNLSQWGLVAPASQSSTSFASWAAAPDEIFVQAVAYTGVDQVAPLRNSGVPNTNSATGQTGATVVMTVTVTNTQAGDVCVVVFHWADNGFHTPVASVSGSNVLRSHNEQNDTGCAIVEFVATGASTVVTCTLTPTVASNIDWGGSGVALVTAFGAASARQVPRFPNKGPQPKNYGARTIGFKQGIAQAVTNTNLDISTPGSITIAGQSVTMGVGVALSTQGAITLAGQSVTMGVGVAPTVGSITLAGQSAAMNLGLALSTQGSITIAGQTVGLAQGTILAIDTPGAITLQGQSVTMNVGASPSVGSITLAGQSAAMSIGLAGGTGSITIAGQSVTAAVGAPLTAGSITIAGQTVTLAVSGSQDLPIDVPGSITILGQDVAMFNSTPADATAGGGGGGSGGKWIEKSTALRTVRRRKRREEEPTVELVSFVQPAVIEPISITPVDISRLADSLTSAPIADWANRLVSDQRLRQSIEEEADKLAELQQEEAEALLVLMIALDE